MQSSMFTSSGNDQAPVPPSIETVTLAPPTAPLPPLHAASMLQAVVVSSASSTVTSTTSNKPVDDTFLTPEFPFRSLGPPSLKDLMGSSLSASPPKAETTKFHKREQLTLEEIMAKYSTVSPGKAVTTGSCAEEPPNPLSLAPASGIKGSPGLSSPDPISRAAEPPMNSRLLAKPTPKSPKDNEWRRKAAMEMYRRGCNSDNFERASISVIARYLKVTRQTVYRWIEKFNKHGEASFSCGKPGPKSKPPKSQIPPSPPLPGGLAAMTLESIRKLTLAQLVAKVNSA